MNTWISDKFKLNSWIVPQVQVPKGYGKRCSRSHSRADGAVIIAYHKIQIACHATGAHATHCLDYFTIRLFTYIFTIFSFSFVHCLALVKPILLNEYDNDKTTLVCILCSLLTNLLHELGRRELNSWEILWTLLRRTGWSSVSYCSYREWKAVVNSLVCNAYR